jgi:AraC-like DNA-binding protein
MARPQLDLDEKIIYAMAERGWSDESIAAAFRCNPQTIRNRFSAELTQCRLAGKNKLLDKMYELALKKDDVQALKYLCDRVLGPIERKTTITLEDARGRIHAELQSRGIDVTEGIKSLTDGSEETED